MANSNELRIGNWLTLGKNKSPERVWKLIYDRNIGHCINSKDTLQEYYDPIPLTTELLEKCGFEFDQITWTLPAYPKLMLAQGTDCFNYWIDTFSGGMMRSVKYLHELQNIFYWLTGGKELTITL